MTKISALKYSEMLPDFLLSSHTVSAPKSLQEKRLEPGLRSWPFFCLFAPFSMALAWMQASEINAVLLRNTSFLHLILILYHKCPLALRMWKYFYPMKNQTSCWTRCCCNCLFSLSLSYISWHAILLIETLILPCWLAGTFLFWEP